MTAGPIWELPTKPIITPHVLSRRAHSRARSPRGRSRGLTAIGFWRSNWPPRRRWGQRDVILKVSDVTPKISQARWACILVSAPHPERWNMVIIIAAAATSSSSAALLFSSAEGLIALHARSPTCLPKISPCHHAERRKTRVVFLGALILTTCPEVKPDGHCAKVPHQYVREQRALDVDCGCSAGLSAWDRVLLPHLEQD